MPFLPLYISELGVSDVGEIAMWSGLTLGATPAITAISAPLWGRVGDRYGSKLLVIRSLGAFVLTKGGDGVRHGAVAAGRAARAARRVRRLRRADDVDGGGVGAARARCRARLARCRWASVSARPSVRSSAACWRRSSGLRRAFLVTAVVLSGGAADDGGASTANRATRHARAGRPAASCRSSASWRRRQASCWSSP